MCYCVARRYNIRNSGGFLPSYSFSRGSNLAQASTLMVNSSSHNATRIYILNSIVTPKDICRQGKASMVKHTWSMHYTVQSLEKLKVFGLHAKYEGRTLKKKLAQG